MSKADYVRSCCPTVDPTPIEKARERIRMGDTSLPDLPGPDRDKPLRLALVKIEGVWCPMWVCDFCGNGPIAFDSGDDCCSSPNATYVETGADND